MAAHLKKRGPGLKARLERRTAAQRKHCGFFVAMACPVLGGRAGGGASSAVAPTVFQLLSGLPSRLKAGRRYITATGATPCKPNPPARPRLLFSISPPSFSVRIVTRKGEPWFVAKDVAEVLDYKWKGIATISHTPEEWRGVYSVQTPSSEQEMLVLSEQGVYFFLGRSDKPKALPFQKWLAGEVLPAIRKTGRYVAPQAPEPAPEQISTNDQRNLQRAIWGICRGFHRLPVWTMAIWCALRHASGCPTPHRFEVRHLSALATELRRIMEITVAVADYQRALEEEAVRRIVRHREAAAPFIAQNKAPRGKPRGINCALQAAGFQPAFRPKGREIDPVEMKAIESAWLNESKPWRAQLSTWSQNDLDAVALRHPAGGSDHSDYAEPKTISAAV